MSTEMSAMSGMPASKTLRLAPAMGRVIDRIFYCTSSQIFKIDKTILHTEVRVSGIRLALIAEIQDDALLFKAMTVDDGKNSVTEEEKNRIAHSSLSTTHTLTKLISAEDAKRLIESQGEENIDTAMLFEERAALAERLSSMLRLVPLDDDDTSLFTGSKSDIFNSTSKGLDLSTVRLETVLFRRMVHMLVSLEGLDMEANGKAGDAADGDSDDRPLPVGSIRIDDSMTLSQAREEIFKQLGAHVELPKDFKFMWRGRPFTKAEERRRTVAESLPSLQLRPVKARRRTRRRVPHGLRVLGKYGDSLLDGISEGNEEEWSESDDDTRRYYTEEDGTVSGSVLYRRSGKRRAGRRRGGSDRRYTETDDGTTSGTGKLKKSSKRGKKRKSVAAMKSERNDERE